MSEPELSRIIKARALSAQPVVVEASACEKQALAKRFGLQAVDELKAIIEVEEGAKAVRAHGKLNADIVQICAVSGEPFAVAIDETIALRFVEENDVDLISNEDDEIEIELGAEDCDEIEYSGDAFDLGEAVAQTLGLAINSYAEGPNADAARKSAGIISEGEGEGPLAAALAALKKD